MNEISQIIIHFFLFLFLTSFPINILTTPKLSRIFNNSYFSLILVNSSILLLIFLILSFFRLNLNYIFFSISSLYIFIFIINSTKIFQLNLFNNNLYLKILFVILCFSLFFNTANNLEIGWDGLGIWLFKANGIYNGLNYSDLYSNEFTYIQYPHLGSYIWAFFWKNSFLQLEYLGRFFYLFIYLVSIFILAENLKKVSTFKRILFVIVILLFSYDYNNTMGGYQELIIFALLIFSAKLLELIQTSKKEVNFITLSIFLLINLLILSWIKNEAFFYSLFLMFIYLLNYKSNSKTIIFFIIGLILITFQIILKKYFFDLEKAFLFSLSTESLIKNINISELIDRIFYTTVYIFHSILKYPISIINLISLIIFLKYFKKMEEYKYYLYFFVFNLIFLYGVYIVTDAPLIWHLKTSIERLILQTSGLYIFILVHLINKKIIKF